MDPVLRAALTSWDLRLDVILVLALAGTIYTSGWWRLRARTELRRRHSRWQAGEGWRPVAYLGGLLVVGIALLSPLDVLSSQLFIMHMVQHVLLVMIAPPLLLLANPLPFMLWGLPDRWRRQIAGVFRPGTRFRRFLSMTTGPGHVWLFFVLVYWGWHDPNAYSLALTNGFVHDLEHITFFLASMLFWWHAVGAGPRIHRPLSTIGRFAFVLSAVPPNMLAGIAIAFANEPIYPYYEHVPRLWGISVMDDQRIAGVIMWVPGSMMYMFAALLLVARWLRQEAEKPALPEARWATDEAMVAPGLNK
jgi:putative membrane protein